MVSLVARTPCEGLGLPLAIGEARLSELELGPAAFVAPFRGQEGAVAEALGAALPAPGRVEALDGGRLLWVGPGRALLVGRPAPEGLSTLAAVAEQGDGIAAVLIEGAVARDVLARLVPIDLRDGEFPDGATARTLLNHMTVTLTRLGPSTFEVMAMRSMARTLVHELTEAMRHVAARAGA